MNKCLFILFGVLAFAVPAVRCWGQEASPPALTGKVSSENEGAMEGVLVSAKQWGSTITVTVVSNDKGEYTFPADRLAPGNYQIAIRAIGYVLDGSDTIQLAASRGTKADLKLKPALIDLEQLTGAELIASAPGSYPIKSNLIDCGDCHSLHRVFNSTHTEKEFLKDVFPRMGRYYPGASDLQPQTLVGDGFRPAVRQDVAEKFARYLSTINLSSARTRSYELTPLPRPTGRATRVIITEYDLQREEIQPHDVVTDRAGNVWYSHFGEQLLSNLDPKTGEIKDFSTPVLKPDEPKGSLDLEVDPDGNVWLAMMYQGAMARFDSTSEKFHIYPVPKEWQTDQTQQSHFAVDGMKADGKVWVKNTDGAQVMKLDPETGLYENLGSFKSPATGRRIGYYGLYSDQQNNVYLLEFADGGIGKIDAKTGELTWYPVPGARPRRGRVDKQGRLWFAEFGANGIGMLDPKTGEIKRWKSPIEWENPYDVMADKNGDVWEDNEYSDRVGRLNPTTGEWVHYPLPRHANMRRVFIDDRGPRPIMWGGNNHAAKVFKLEPLD